MTENEKLFEQYFKVNTDKSVVFIGEKMIIKITEEFIRLNIAEIVRQTINTLGILEGYIFDDMNETDISKCNHKFVIKIPSIIKLNPSHIEPSFVYEEDVESETLIKLKAYDMTFLKNDVFLDSTLIIQNIHTTDKFISMMLNGHIPKSIRYDELSTLYQNSAHMNGSGTLGADFNSLVISVMQLTRDPMDYSVPFRMVYDKYYAKGIYNGKMVRYMDIPKYISNFTSLTTADPKHGITVAMNRVHGEKQKDQKSPVEDLIM